jgi:transcriptional regulator with XRE-family HTH domain
MDIRATEWIERREILSFAENLARIQAERGVTNYRIAKEIDVNQTSIVNWKNGTKPHPRNVKRLADYFNVSVDELLSGDKSEK